MNLDNLGTQLLFTTLPLWIENNDNSKSTGTGFIYTLESKSGEGIVYPFLVTNYHVIHKADRVLIEFIEGNDTGPVRDKKMRVELDGEFSRQFVDTSHDLAVIPLAPILNQFASSGKTVFYRTISPNMIPTSEQANEFSAIEDVTFIGYPSGIYDFKNSSPLVRKGITSTPVWNDFKGEKCFLIDAGVFPGSSGSPVFIYNEGSYTTSQGIAIGSRLLFLGIISETIIRNDGVSSNVYLGLGKVIKAQVLQNFVSGIARQLETVS
ncbi:trypsin-like peptidase domain-containing protein [Vibrio vulnificus]|uniref:S1 family peptidase n=1 Tax=Vibrio vulnificus TaxID=672 RepID=UPI001CDBB6F9|nr:trypsin-like peptidase domain-containing protein [Vibrio vulnificus]MCA3906947.1 trypsin-like peptidase domain-containing protein [Vibrio vulnificus]